MNSKKIAFVVLVFTTFCNIIKAQQNNIGNKNYSVIIPDDYRNQGKSYPLMVCFKNQATDTLLQQYVKDKQIIILQFDNIVDAVWEYDSLKAIIQKTMQKFPLARDKIYLLGVNENINKTAEMREALNYYFAATAYITSNQFMYTLLNDSLKQNDSVKLYFFDAIDYKALDTVHKLFIQNYLWALNVKKISEDATKLNFNKIEDKEEKNRISLSYGQLYFNNSAKSKKKSFLEFPENMGIWQLSFARYFSKSLSANINLGILLKKIEPPRPSVFSILNGTDVDIEGGGIFLMPISIGVDYFFLKQRFRPYTGFNIGMIPAKYKYIEASGNISNGINRNEFEFDSNAPFIELSSGFIYHIEKNLQFGLNYDYLQSKDFNENIGGFKAYNGFKISISFSFAF